MQAPATLLKKRLWHRCFTVNFPKFLRTTFSQNTSGRLLLLLVRKWEVGKMKVEEAVNNFFYCSSCYVKILLIECWWKGLKSHQVFYISKNTVCRFAAITYRRTYATIIFIIFICYFMALSFSVHIWTIFV